MPQVAAKRRERREGSRDHEELFNRSTHIRELRSLLFGQKNSPLAECFLASGVACVSKLKSLEHQLHTELEHSRIES